jgi:hypothetical protein
MNAAPLTLSASFSWLTVKGPATVVGGSGAPRPTTASESGLGDIYAGATYQFGSLGGVVDVSGSARVKLPTADEDRGLGTGAADYYAELTFFRTFGSVTPFLTAGYRVLGDADTYDLRDGAYASGGAHFRLSAATVVTALLSWRRPIVAGGDDAQEGLLMVSHDFAERWRVTAYALKGFTDASPDFGTGARGELAVLRRILPHRTHRPQRKTVRHGWHEWPRIGIQSARVFIRDNPCHRWLKMNGSVPMNGD